MNRTEALRQAKPILFNTEMVRAILDGRKTRTSRIVKKPYYIDNPDICRVSGFAMHSGINATNGMPDPDRPYRPGDILYVRETWAINNITPNDPKWLYKADHDCSIRPYSKWKWCPSIHMPKEAARIFLRVTDVRVERLQDITPAEARQEGVKNAEYNPECEDKPPWVLDEFELTQFSKLWNSTIPKKDLDRYGWNANPWVWVYEFERIEVTE